MFAWNSLKTFAKTLSNFEHLNTGKELDVFKVTLETRLAVPDLKEPTIINTDVITPKSPNKASKKVQKRQKKKTHRFVALPVIKVDEEEENIISESSVAEDITSESHSDIESMANEALMNSSPVPSLYDGSSDSSDTCDTSSIHLDECEDMQTSSITEEWALDEFEKADDEEQDLSAVDDDINNYRTRDWNYFTPEEELDSGAFIAMSWNILSPNLTNTSRFHSDSWPYLDWEYRKHAILGQIIGLLPDFVCLQEVEPEDFEYFFKPALEHYGYSGFYENKINQIVQDGCATFYKQHRFELIKTHVIRYNETNLDDEDRHSLARDTAIRFNMFNNLALVGVFRNKETQSKLCVANTHLLADPEYQDAKLLQAAILIDRLQKIKYPTVICGDLNSLPTSSVLQYLVSGRAPSSVFSGHDFGRYSAHPLRHQLRLRNAYTDKTSPKLLYTNRNKNFRGVIDHILYTVHSLDLLAVLDGLPKEQGHLQLPNWHCPSDHLPLVSVFCEKDGVRLALRKKFQKSSSR
ncbi:hypothetical protein K493DRAFT_21375 [Basidiobolus meristosporus CBS 931.73]|uniref:Endonuclease/exonuclease/phosphatase domain-containing protein n=1 Tax=Basidiobolus meristosporus CBS 931.73 TaxID=1314790 RepID=A0A1Y1YDV6_9FUNG|nr:hypothetical protein K493DRAFT_21375 [Basidiobolus meristosporus CBS 931.73]|eukprot:ORX96103.1 hypothetical protein K493DRAFT_21375 [Basidiobolus meristosporus CBS 931.73]